MDLVYYICFHRESNYQKRSIKCRKRYFFMVKAQKTLSRQSLLTHDRKRSLAYNEDEQYKSVVFNRAFPS